MTWVTVTEYTAAGILFLSDTLLSVMIYLPLARPSLHGPKTGLFILGELITLQLLMGEGYMSKVAEFCLDKAWNLHVSAFKYFALFAGIFNTPMPRPTPRTTPNHSTYHPKPDPYPIGRFATMHWWTERQTCTCIRPMVGGNVR